MMEGPKAREVRSARAQRGEGLGRGAVVPPQYRKIFQKINVEIAYFLHFFKLINDLICNVSIAKFLETKV